MRSMQKKYELKKKNLQIVYFLFFLFLTPSSILYVHNFMYYVIKFMVISEEEEIFA